jgi:hypothetical protein
VKAMEEDSGMEAGGVTDEDEGGGTPSPKDGDKSFDSHVNRIHGTIERSPASV